MEPDQILLFLNIVPYLTILAITAKISLLWGAMICLIFFSAMISGSEVAYFSLEPDTLHHLSKEKSKTAKSILRFIDNPRRLLATILISNNLINIAIILLSELLLNEILPESLILQTANYLAFLDPYINISFTVSIFYKVGIVTFILVLFGELMPKIYGRYYNLQLAKIMARPLLFLDKLLSPLSSLLVNETSVFEQWLLKRKKLKSKNNPQDINKAIELTVQDEQNATHQIDFLKNIIKFNDVSVNQIYKPRVDVIALDIEDDFLTVLKTLKESSHSRIPVFEEDFDHVKGILYAKDLIGHHNDKKDFDWVSKMRKDVMYIPESKMINDLLKEFQQQKKHIAIVVDEYGGSMGIVTMEDIIEEVIGEIRDEFDDEPDVDFEKINSHTFRFDGKTLLNDVCRIVDIDVDSFDQYKDEADSIAGIILEKLGLFPQKNQTITIGLYRFKIISVTKRRIEKIDLILPKKA